MSLRGRLDRIERGLRRARRNLRSCANCRAPRPSLPRYFALDLSSPSWRPSLCPTCNQHGGRWAIALDDLTGEPEEAPLVGAFRTFDPAPGETDELAQAVNKWGEKYASHGVLLDWLEARPRILGRQHEAMLTWLRARIPAH